MNFRKRYYRILAAAGIEKKGLHSLRHTFASSLVNGIKQEDGSHAARLIDIDAYDVKGGKCLYGFLAGICAGNYDVTDILVDSTLKITGTGAEVMDLLVNDLKKLEKESGANFVLSVSAADEEIPESVKEYVAK